MELGKGFANFSSVPSFTLRARWSVLILQKPSYLTCLLFLEIELVERSYLLHDIQIMEVLSVCVPWFQRTLRLAHLVHSDFIMLPMRWLSRHISIIQNFLDCRSLKIVTFQQNKLFYYLTILLCKQMKCIINCQSICPCQFLVHKHLPFFFQGIFLQRC